MSRREIAADEGERPVLRKSMLDEDPARQWQVWLSEASTAGSVGPPIAALATATPDGIPSVRMVIARVESEGRVSFFTDLHSRKASELERNSRVALVFYWPALRRQVRMEGTVSRVTDGEADEVFAARPRERQLVAHVTEQFRVLASRDELEARLTEAREHWDGRPIERPASWSGFHLEPTIFEFWQGSDSRLHDRFRYRRLADGRWKLERLEP